MATIFSKIIQGEIPSYKIAETDLCYAFLDIRPLNAGHTLVIPKQEIDYIFDLEDDLLSALIVFSKKISSSIKAILPCERIGMSVIGLEVPHAHIHLIPINGINDMNFLNEPKRLSEEEFKEIANKISNYYYNHFT